MSKFTRIALALGLVAASTFASAADESANIAVTATVPGVCRLTAPATLAITADPSVGGNASNTASVSFKCTKNMTYNFTVNTENDGSVSGNLTGAVNAETMPYTATWTQPSGTGIGFSTAVNANIAVTITQANYEDKSADSYTGTVAVNINY